VSGGRENSWILSYREAVNEGGKIIRRQKCVKLAEYGDRYRCEKDLDELVAEKLAAVRQAAKCPHSSDSFVDYVEQVYLPFVLRTMKPSTYSGYSTYWKRYIEPRVGKYALRDFTVAIVASLLKDISAMHELNRDTVTKIRSVLSGIFSYAMSEGHFPARSAADNPASRARIPESATKPKCTVAATFEEVQGILRALKGLPLERAAVGIMALSGVRPSEARGLRWEEWDRTKQHIAARRGVWHRIVGTTKTEQSERFVAVSDELREILLDLLKAQGSPISGYILAGPRKSQPVILDNMAKRSVVPALNRCAICKEMESAEHKGHEFQRDETLPQWHGWYSLRRFVGTEVRMKADSETSAKALGNSKAVADKHYIKPKTVLPDVRKAVNDAVSGLIS
jgi:integrase